MKISESSKKIKKKTNWVEVFERLDKAKSGTIVLEFPSKAEAVRKYNSLTNPTYKKKATPYLRGKKIYLEKNEEATITEQ